MAAFTDADFEAFERDGYVVARGLFSAEEMRLLHLVGKADAGLLGDTLDRHDTSGHVTRLALRNDLRDDLYSAIVRSERMVRPMERMLGGEVYHYHHKMNMKEPKVGGAWEWHQDYGYWYDNGCLFPYMASAMIAVDEATIENGCLQVIKGSHHMGRIEHGVVADQTGADMERVNQALKQMELVHVTMQPGDTLFFHSNLLHRSDANLSDKPRWVLICCYNAARNDPYKVHHHPNYTPLEVWPDERVLEAGQRQAKELQLV
ncbi:MAG: phytanoyl-CoA dioxygenase family protein [Candidatus Hydrogenedens sp.]|nr:phytanoyl-CoA dioxygenase family protein [Candidatus Hydrogenedens sp.]